MLKVLGSRRNAWFRQFGVALWLALSALIVGLAAPLPVFSAPPVRGLLTRSLSAIPSGADAIRVSIFGDKSGSLVQIRLLGPKQDGVFTGYFAAPPIVVDFEGWKTFTLPLSDFSFGSDTNPDAREDGLSDKSSLSSSDKIQIAVTASSSRLFFDDLGWTTAGASATDAPIAAIDTYDSASLKQWRAVGDYEQLRSVTFGGITSGPQVKNGKGALQVVVRSPALNERQLNKPATDVKLSKSVVPYVVYIRSPFDSIFSESVPSIKEMATPPDLKITACADEIEPASFAVYSVKELKGATVRITGAPTSATKAVIPSSALDVRVVRAGETYPAPLVLMKDDRQPLSTYPAVVRLTGEPTTDIAAGTSKQFWLTVRVPRNQAPGIYKGRLTFSATGTKPTIIPVTIEVPNLTLKTAFLQYGIELRSRAAKSGDTLTSYLVAQETYSAQLANIRDHGFRLLNIYQSVPNLDNDLRLYKAANLSAVGPVVVSVTDTSEVAGVEALRPAVGLTPSFEIYYFIGPEGLSSGTVSAFGRAVNAANRNALVSAIVETSSVYAMLRDALNDPNGEEFAPIYPVCSDYAQKVLQERKRSTPNRDYWRWSIADQTPLSNRLLTGFLLYKTGPGFYGAFPGPYQRIPEGVSPYAPFDASNGIAPPNLPSLTTVPVEGGVLDTVQWEAAREGVDDIRYIGALKAIIRELKDAKRAKELTEAAEAMLANMIAKPLHTLPPAQHQAMRVAILQETLKLKKQLPGK